jgi:catechol-2,3-dioxygenase
MKTLVFVLVVMPVGIVISPFVAILAGVSSFFMSFLTYWHHIVTNYWAKPAPKCTYTPPEEVADIWEEHVKRLKEKNKLN